MTISLHDGVIALEGDCHLEEAETLSAMLSAGVASQVDIRHVGEMHAAVFQLLLMHAKIVVGPPPDGFVRRWLNSSLLAAKSV